jgi:hypothetical protein
MAGRRVTTPVGEQWRVRRLWAPRLGGESLAARLRRRTRLGRSLARGAGEAGDVGCLLDALSDIFWVFVIVVVVAVLLLVGVPLLLAIVDVVVVALLTLLAIGARVVFRRPWAVEAVGPDGAGHTWRVVGWQASGDAVDAVANALEHGNPLPTGATSPGAVTPSRDRTDRPE